MSNPTEDPESVGAQPQQEFPQHLRLPTAPQGPQPPPPRAPLPPRSHQAAAYRQPSAPWGQGSREPLPEVKPDRLWYWAGGSVFPVTLLISILLLTDNPGASPGLIVGGILLPMLAFGVSLVVCLTVFIVRSTRLSQQRLHRIRQAGAAYGVPGEPPRAPGPHGPPRVRPAPPSGRDPL